MKFKLIGGTLLLLAFGSFAQTPNPVLTDTLVKNKQLILAKYIPMANGEYLYSGYQIPLDVFVKKVEDFKAALNKQIDQEKNQTLKDLKRKDIEFYSYNVLDHYRIYYGMDSVGMENFAKVLQEKKAAPNYYQLIDSAHKLAFTKKLTVDERKSIESLVRKNGDVNQVALFKTSAAYRTWLNDYLKEVQRKKYPADTAYGYGGDHVAMLKAISAEISDPFIKEYLLYTFTGTVIKSVKNEKAKENAYNDFMAAVTNQAYKTGIQEIYTNYKNMTAHVLAPEFTYVDVDGKDVSLKALRGKYVYIDVWATWCGPCKAEIPFLTKIEHEYQDKNIHFVSLSVDRIADKAKWHAYVKDNKLQGIQVLADKDFSSDFVKKFNINSIPRFILIDPAGKIVSGDAKRPSDPELRKELDKLLK